MENYRRNNFLSVIDSILSSIIKVFVPWLIIILGRYKNRESDFLSPGAMLAIFGTIIVAVIIYFVAKWFKNVYFISERFLVIREGVFVVKSREIPLSKIQTINISQNIKQRVLHIASLKVDTGNSSIGISEVSITVGKAEAELLREQILRLTQNSTEANFVTEYVADSITKEKQKIYTVSNIELIKTGITSNAVFAGIAFIGSIYTFFDDILSTFLDENIRKLENLFGGIEFNTMSVSTLTLTISAIILIFLMFSFTFSVLGTFIKYYGFSAERAGKNIIINYGLLEKKNYILPISKIKAVYIKQNLLRQFCGLKAIYVESIGYGNEKGEEAILYPITGQIKQIDIMKNLLPEFVFEGKLIKVPKRTLGRFIISSLAVPFLLFAILSILFEYGYLSMIIVLVFLFRGILEYKNSAAGIAMNLLCMSSKAFEKTTSIIKVRDIQSTSERTNIFQRKRKIFNFEVSIQSNTFGKTIKVKNLDEALKEEFMGLV
ncbi:MAG: PH domain-containing protein [Clostridia bacterium]|nr:PH domain-containing protein [Clostridia bacterium]